MTILNDTPLGKNSQYRSTYSPELLYSIPRSLNRKQLGIAESLPFIGQDRWTTYELSWLQPGGKPACAIGTFFIPHDSTNIIESKSLKLYLNALNQTVFESVATLKACIQEDLSKAAGAPVKIDITPLHDISSLRLSRPTGLSLDTLPITTDCYTVNPNFLSTTPAIVTETLYTELLKSNCLVTGQPDWATLQITYKGPQISHTGLLMYAISYRNHQDFHENCVEHIFCDIMDRCTPTLLTVEALYTRRGGLDINPTRSNDPNWKPHSIRLLRQ